MKNMHQKTEGNTDPVVDYAKVFHAMPDICAILSVPDFRILGATDAYCALRYMTRDDILNKPLFDIFPENPSPNVPKIAARLKDSLQRAFETKAPSKAGIIRYDIRRHEALGGGFEERWWRTTDYPVVEDGTVLYIIHVGEDVSHMLDVLEEAEDAMHERRRVRHSSGMRAIPQK